MTAPKRPTRSERREVNRRAHYVARAERKPGDPLLRVAAATDRARQAIKRATPSQALHMADVIIRAMDAVVADSQNTSRRAR